MTSRLTSSKLISRIIWAYTIYLLLVVTSFAAGYFLIPRQALLNSPWTVLGTIAASPESPCAQFFATVGFNLAFVLILGVGLNLQRVNGFPTGFVFIFSAGIMSGIIAGTNSFALQVISPYTINGWLAAIRIQHLELLGYTIIVASTISLGLSDYSSWLPWKAKETRIQNWREIHFTQQEITGVVIGIVLILLAAYNETTLAL